MISIIVVIYLNVKCRDFIIQDNLKYSKEYEKQFNKSKLINHVLLLKELDATKYSKDSFVLGHVGPNTMNDKLSRGGFDITLLKKPSK